MLSRAADVSDQVLASFIDGSEVGFSSQEVSHTIDPSTGKHCAQIAFGTVADVDRAVGSARAAFERGDWSEAAPSLRKRVLQRLADLIEINGTTLDRLDAEDMGKPIREAACNGVGASQLVRFCAEAVDKISGEVNASDKNSLVMQRLVPRGVVAALAPWNFPAYVAMLKVAPALCAGNSVVLKPSEHSSRSALYIAKLAIQAGLPAGVLNVVPGPGETLGRALGLHMDVDMLTFTGSTRVGGLMMQYAGQSNLKLVKAECGGKSPQIVFGDGVDLDAAAASIARGLLVNQGQICSVGSRLLVQRSIQSQLVDKIAEHFGRVRIGAAIDPETTFGPIVSASRCRSVMEHIEAAVAEGAELVTGGRRTLLESGGNFIEPTLFRNVAPSARLAQEEVFGPVLAVIPFDDEAEAVRIANSTRYGLMAYVWTASMSVGMRMAKRMRSPVVVHSAAASGEGAGYAFSFEPARQSGVGAEGGIAGIESYLRRQYVRFNHD